VPSTLAEALTSASSDDVEVRAAAGVLLASAPDLDQVTDVLIRLLLDQEDTFVTSETVEALMDRRDVPGLRLVLVALARADESAANWIRDGLLDPQTYEELAERTSLLEALASESDVAATARTVLERLRA